MELPALFEELQKHNVRYLICGGLAVNIYGIPRSTADVDLLLDFEKKNITAFETVMKKLSYVSHIPVSIAHLTDKNQREKLIREKNLITYSFFNSRSNTMNIDVLMDVPVSFESLWKNREVKRGGKYEANFVSLDDLIKLKKYSNRLQDQQDILLLSKIKNGKKKK